MRTIIIQDTSVLALMIVIIVVVISLFSMPFRAQMWVYPLARQAVQLKEEYETRDMLLYETQHFKIKYMQSDADTVEMIATAAEAAYVPVTQELGYAPSGKALLVVQPNKSQLRKAFGWSGNESAMGVYWGGVIQLLSPHAWLKEGATVDEFIHSGPMVHEYTHLVFDYLTNGNYPRWFTEGLAQSVEFDVNQYEWHTPTNKLDGTLYTMAELDRDFDTLPNQSLAYRQSLAAVRYIREVYGKDKLSAMIVGLQKGQSMEGIISKTLNMDYATFEKASQQWAVANM